MRLFVPKFCQAWFWACFRRLWVVCEHSFGHGVSSKKQSKIIACMRQHFGQAPQFFGAALWAWFWAAFGADSGIFAGRHFGRGFGRHVGHGFGDVVTVVLDRL